MLIRVYNSNNNNNVVSEFKAIKMSAYFNYRWKMTQLGQTGLGREVGRRSVEMCTFEYSNCESFSYETCCRLLH